MNLMRKILKIAGCVLCSLGIIWFLLPILKGEFSIGMVFGILGCTVGLLLLLLFRRLSSRGGWKQVTVRFVTVLYVAGVLWCGYLTVLMNSALHVTPPENANVILLGAQVFGPEKPGVSLSYRIDAAFRYLEENPKAKCIVTGGQGKDEPCTEALTQKNLLVQRGIAEERIYLEDQSRNTRQNMRYAMEIAERENLGNAFAVVTQNFHMYRAMQLADSTGITAYSVVADTDPLLFPAYYGRELLSLTKWQVERLFLEP